MVVVFFGWAAVSGPKRSTLQAMLANLGSEEELPALQTGSASPPRQSPNNNNDIDDGKCEICLEIRSSSFCNLRIQIYDWSSESA